MYKKLDKVDKYLETANIDINIEELSKLLAFFTFELYESPITFLRELQRLKTDFYDLNYKLNNEVFCEYSSTIKDSVRHLNAQVQDLERELSDLKNENEELKKQMYYIQPE